MTLVRHILAKDLRLVRWVLGGWIALSVIDAIDRVLVPRLMAFDEHWIAILPMWLLLTSVAYGLVLVLFVATDIQAERLVGTTAFWLTRPIPRDALLGSKLLGLFLFVMLPALAIEAILMAAFQVPLTALFLALLQQAWVMAIVLLVLAFGATLTATATRLLFLIVGTLVALYIGLLMVFAISLTGVRIDSGPKPPPKPADISDVIVASAIFAMGVLVAIRHHYKRRRHAIAVLIFAASGVLALLVVGLWPHISLLGGEPTVALEPWARDPSLSLPRFDTRNRLVREETYSTFGLGHLEPRMMTSLAAPVSIEGLPSNYTARPFTIAAQVRFADGQTIESQRHSATGIRVSITPGVSTPGPNDLVSSEFWPTLMFAPTDVFKRDGDRPGVYHGTFYYTSGTTH